MTEPEETDAELSWRRHQFRGLYDDNYDDLLRYCLRRTSSLDEAEDVLAETFSVAWSRLGVVPKGAEARLWLFGVARNQRRAGWRKAKRSNELHERLVSAHVERRVIDPADLAADRSHEILTAMSTLSSPDLDILMLATWDGLTHAEIATLLSCSENTVAKRVSRARTRLRKAMTNSSKARAGSPSTTPSSATGKDH